VGRIGLQGEEKAPPKTEGDFVADYLELLCLDNSDGWAGFGELQVARRRARDTGRTGETSLVSLIQDPARGGILTPDVDEGTSPDLGDQPAREAADAIADPEADIPVAESPPPVSDEEIADVHAHLEHRAEILGDAYPFGVSEDGLELLAMTRARLLYAALLICSCQKYLEDSKCVPWRRFFERFGRYVLVAYFGNRTTVEVFGTAALEGEAYHGDLRNAVELLAKNMGYDLTRYASELGTSGDFGLDLVAKLDFASSDEADLQLVVFAQTGTGKDWREKQEESGRVRWSRVLSITGPFQQALLIPYFWRKTNGEWRKAPRLHTSNVVFDRQRILFLAGDDPPLDEAPALLQALAN
jgi:hypothetical protein